VVPLRGDERIDEKMGTDLKLERYIRSYWGKARPSENTLFAWHPLAYHSLDVAAAMAALLDIRPAWLASVVRLSGLAPGEARKRLVLVAALHDIGKFAENFQWKAEAVFAALQPEADRRLTNPRGHGDVGHRFWQKFSDDREDDGLEAIERWLMAAVSHHGAPTDGELILNEAMSKSAQVDAIAYCDAVFDLLGAPTMTECRSKVETWRVAGLVILADWIGSNQAWFPYCEPTLDLAAYWPIAQAKAARAVREAELEEAATASAFDLPDLLARDACPSPLQTWAMAETPPAAPTLYVIEDVTGSGKTEAALILAHRLMAAGQAEGIYWALPTMATANGLYLRLETRYQRMFSADGTTPSLVLAHSSRDLNTTFQASIGEAFDARYGSDSDAQSQAAEAHCAAFIAEDRKKTILAQVGVGTLDQALLGVLPVRHQALRLAALSRRVLVIDEAHAYDPYMTAALERLLSFQAGLGGSAIVLSATLTGAQRRKFAAAYACGSTAALTETAFPLITRASADGCMEAPQKSTRGARRDLLVRRQPSPEAAMDGLLSAARDGRCGVYVRNTIKDALEAVAYLRVRAGADAHVSLFHARFALGDRLARENEVLNRFGIASLPKDRRGHILVATQVVEQSLDLDFDHMASDLCPMDLLIQRAGRLQRHGHRPARPLPVLDVVTAEAIWEAPVDWYAAMFPNGQWVYPDVGQLWRTQSLLQTFGGLPLEARSSRELIEPVFGDDPLDIPAALIQASDAAQGKGVAARAIGFQNALDRNQFFRSAGAWDSDIRTPTRLGEPSVIVRLARWCDGTLSPWFADANPYRAWRLSELSLRVSQFQAAIAPDNACEAEIKRTQDSWPSRFDPPPILALTPGDDGVVWLGGIVDARGRTIVAIYSSVEGLRL
jgi:CRISPR-associated endonuclease/helicase Cas3